MEIMKQYYLSVTLAVVLLGYVLFVCFRAELLGGSVHRGLRDALDKIREVRRWLAHDA